MVEAGYWDKPRPGVPEGVDPRLDNRTGSDRAKRETSPAVPQQVDGPDLAHQADHAEAVAAAAKNAEEVERVGMYSAGDHSTAGDEARGGNHAGQAGDVLETDPGSPASESTSVRDGDAEVAADKDSAVQVAKAARAAAGAADSETATAAPGERRARSRADKKE